MRIFSYITVLCLLALAVSATCCTEGRSKQQKTSEAEEANAAKESATSQDTVKGTTYKNLVNGQDISLESLKGHVLLIDFWATWCGPCRMEIPGFIDLYDKYKDKKVTIVGISLDRTGQSVVKRFIEQYRINYPIIMATSQLVNDYQRAIGRPIQSIPTTIIMNREGEIAAVHVGAKPKQVFEEEIQKLL